MIELPDIQYGPKIRMLRKRAGLSLDEAADLLDISRTTLIRYEKESPRLPVSIFIQMTEIYNCSVFDILGVHEDVFGCMEWDVSPYYLMKAQAYYLVTKERETQQLFGGSAFSAEYYNQRYRLFTRETVEKFLRFPAFKERAEEISAIAAADEDFECAEK